MPPSDDPYENLSSVGTSPTLGGTGGLDEDGYPFDTDATRFGRDPRQIESKDPNIYDKTLGRARNEIIMPSTLETIDRAFHQWIDEHLNIFSTTQKGWNKVPVIWVSAERAFQIKNDKNLRDKNGVLKLPLITLERTSIVKDSTMSGKVTSHVPFSWGSDPSRRYRGGEITISRRIQQEKTANYAAVDSAKKRGPIGETTVGHGQLYFPRKNKKVVYETITIPLPVYINVTYSVKIKAEYHQQINEILTPFIVNTGQINNFRLSYDNHRYEGFLPKDFGQNNAVADMGEDERSFETTIDIRVLGHLIGADKNQETPKVVRRENFVQIRMPRERVIMMDEVEEAMGAIKVARKDRFYKE
jgi:hypothetical protein